MFIRFADVHYDQLVDELKWARSFGAWAECAPPTQHPTRAQRIEVIKDRLIALTKCTTADLRGRWFGLYDRARDLVPVWTALLCALTYREMVMRGFGTLCPKLHASIEVAPMKPSSVDKGILKCAVGILCTDVIRSEIITWVALNYTFRARSGMRTANTTPPGFQNMHTPWSGHAHVTATQLCARATGGYLDEINETLHSVHTGSFAIDRDEFARLTFPFPTSCTMDSLLIDSERTDDGVWSADKAPDMHIQPDKMLLRLMSTRVRSQGVHELGVLKFASLLHPSNHVAHAHFVQYKAVLDKCMAAALVTTDKPIPDSIKQSFTHLFRDDLFVEACNSFVHMQTPDCARPYIGHIDLEGGDATASQPGMNDGIGGVHLASINSSDEKEANLEAEEREKAMTDDERRDRGFRPKCSPPCTCCVHADPFRRILLAMCTSLHGTKFVVEDGFNSMRSATDARSKKSRGNAEISMCTKYMAQHACTLKQERRNTSSPVKVHILDLENDSQLYDPQQKANLRAHFTNQQKERCAPIYEAVRALTGKGTFVHPENAQHLANTPYASVAPKNQLGALSVQLLASFVPYVHWDSAWLCSLIPDDTILYNPTSGEFRVKLATPKAHGVFGWPCTLRADALHGGGFTCTFDLLPLHECSIEKLYVFPKVCTTVYELNLPAEESQHEWHAMRTEGMHTTWRDGYSTVGRPLSVGVPRKQLECFRAVSIGVDGSIGAPPEEPRSHPHGSKLRNLMDTVPLLEWMVEEGLPGAPETTIRELLQEIRIKEQSHAAQALLETPRARIDRIRKKVRTMKSVEMFDALLEAVCAHFTEAEKATARQRYID